MNVIEKLKFMRNSVLCWCKPVALRPKDRDVEDLYALHEFCVERGLRISASVDGDVLVSRTDDGMTLIGKGVAVA